MSFKYERGAAMTLQSGASAALAAGTAVLGDTPYDNSNTNNLFFWADLEFVGNFGVAPTAGKALEAYLIPAEDGTNYADADNVTPNYSLLAGTFATRNVATAQRIVLNGVPLRPALFRLYLRNQADQALAAGWIVNIYPYRQQ